MKGRILLLLVLVAWLASACHPNRYIRTILKDDLRRSQIYHEILKNDAYRAQMLDSIRNNKSTRILMNTSQNEGANLNKTGKKKLNKPSTVGQVNNN
jgi:hypothetical protein